MGARPRLSAALLLGSLPALTAALFGWNCGGRPAGAVLTLGATTTIDDSGLLHELVGAYQRARPGVRVRVVTGGTGEMLRLAERADVDATLTHDPAAEAALVAAGHGVERRDAMWNHFVIAGPAADPAELAGMRDAPAALRRVAAARAPFVSRGDDSGTHRKERQLWDAAGMEPDRRAGWYVEAGLGMGDALRLADERGAYILTDRATFLTFGDGLELVLHVEGDPRLVNRYGVMRVTAARNAAEADAFVHWLTGPEGQAVIEAFGRDRFGRPLFVPGPATAGP